jgi:hypothetical protein
LAQDQGNRREGESAFFVSNQQSRDGNCKVAASIKFQKLLRLKVCGEGKLTFVEGGYVQFFNKKTGQAAPFAVQ